MTEKKIAAGTGDVTWHDYVEADGKRVAMRVFDEQTLNTTWNYFVHDHLGSIVAAMDSLGNVVERMSFDAWGKRREPATAAFYAAGFTPSFTTPRGFTGHEHIDEVGLVNMNARVYDPELGRFLQPDVFVQDDMASATLNRYTYVANNPLSYTDPSGHFIWTAVAIFAAAVALTVKNPIIRALAGIVLFATLNFQVLPGIIGDAVATAAAAGFISGGITGGSLKSAFLGGITAAIGVGLISEFGLGSIQHVLGAAITGGLSAAAQGGEFVAGFISAGLSAMAGPVIQTLNDVAGAVVSAIIGGVSSVLGGGKFLSGAVTGAFAFMYGRAVGQSHNREDTTINQDSIDKVKALPDTLSEREAIFEQGLAEAKRQGLLRENENVRAELDTILIKREDGGLQQFSSKESALDHLNRNPNSHVIDGTELGRVMTIYATAVSPQRGIVLYPGSIYYERYIRGLGDGIGPLSAVENALQTIAHETGHREGIGHDGRMTNREGRAILCYRRQCEL